MSEWQISRVRVTASIEWPSRVGSGRLKYGRICEYIVLNINIFNVEYHAIIEIVECESGRVAQKWSSASIEVLGHSLLKTQFLHVDMKQYSLLNLEAMKTFRENVKKVLSRKSILG